MEDQVFVKLAQAIDRGPTGAPKADWDFSRAFLAYLQLLYTAEEAHLLQHLKMGSKFTPAEEIAKLSGVDVAEVVATLKGLGEKGRIIALGENYSLLVMPQLLNYHQFREEVGPDDLEAARLYQQFFIKEGYSKYYETSEKGTSLMRVISVQRTIEEGEKILDTEEARSEERRVGKECRSRWSPDR